MRGWLVSHPWGLVPVGTLVVVGAATAWYLGSPLFVRTTLVEAPPRALNLPGDAIGARSQPPSLDAPTATSAAPQGVQILGQGSFFDRDQLHRGAGQAILARGPDGGRFLRFDDFSVTNGPDLHVLLSTTERPTTHDEVYNGVYVGKLKAPQGAFHYELPPETDLNGIRSVVIYCVPFRVIFSSAPLTAR